VVKRDIRAYLDDILVHIDLAQNFVEGMTFQDFQDDDKTILAVTRALEIIGEAAKQVPPAIREQYSDISWRDITGMRDRIAHVYFGIDLEIVWSTAQNRLSTLRSGIQNVLEDMEITES